MSAAKKTAADAVAGKNRRLQQESFDRAAAGYRQHAGVQVAMADWLAEWLPQSREGRALELGAGPGIFTRRLLPWTGRLTVTDASAAMCATGRAELPGLDWQKTEAVAPLAGPWDWIFSSSMLQWAEDPAAIFSAWRDRLAPRGRVLVGLFAAPSLPELAALMQGQSPLVWRSPKAWRAALEQSGLNLVRDGAETRVVHHPSARVFLSTLHGVGAAPERRLTIAALRRLLRDYEDRHRETQGVRATWTFYRFEAVRQ